MPLPLPNLRLLFLLLFPIVLARLQLQNPNSFIISLDLAGGPNIQNLDHGPFSIDISDGGLLQYCCRRRWGYRVCKVLLSLLAPNLYQEIRYVISFAN